MYQNSTDIQNGKLISQQRKTILASFTLLFTFLTLLSWVYGGA